MSHSTHVAFSAVVVVGLLAAGCGDSADPLRPAQRGPAVDLVQGGNGHFFFLPPLGPTPQPNGAFNPRLAPVVEICVLNQLRTACAAPPFASFTRTGGTMGETIAVDPGHERYAVDWDTGDYGLADGVYRVFVRSGPSGTESKELGYADVAIAQDALVAHQMAGPGTLSLATGQTLPIQFRIEEGALCAATSPTCFEGSVGNAGGTVTDGEAGVQFPQGAVPEEAGLINIVIERYKGPNACLPTFQPQYEGCYRLSMEPHVALEKLVVIGVCLDPAAYGFVDQMELQKWNEVDPQTLISLPKADVDFLECDDFVVGMNASGFMGRLARAVAPVLDLVRPRPLYAGIRPFGGTASDFSRVGWVRPLAISAAAGDGQTGTAGVALPVNPTAAVKSRLTGAPVAGVPVGFAVTAGGGFVDPMSAATDGAGLASAVWTLGAPGANALLVSGSNPLTSWPNLSGVWGTVGFSAQAVAPPQFTVLFLTPLGDAHAGSPQNAANVSPVLTVCRWVSGACAETIATLMAPTLDRKQRTYQAEWNTPRDLPANQFYRVQVRVNGSVIGGATIAPKTDNAPDDGVFRFEPGRTVPVKFSIVAG